MQREAITLFEEPTSSAARRTDQEILGALSRLQQLGKSSGHAVALFEGFERGVSYEHHPGWTPQQVWAACEYACLCALRVTLCKLASPAVSIYLAHWLAEACGETTRRRVARRGGQRPKLQQNILKACKHMGAKGLTARTAPHATRQGRVQHAEQRGRAYH